jgi:glycosyltransferase involved in cell wall biosynthesis
VNPDVLHVHDLPLVEVALDCPARRTRPVIADLHENWPAAMQAWRAARPAWKRWLGALRRPDFLMRRFEVRCVSQCERVIVVVPEAAERLLSAGIAKQRIVIVSNTEDESTMPDPLPIPSDEVKQILAGRWTICYVGGIGPHRGLDTVIRGLPEIRRQVPNLLLLVVGAKGSQGDRVEQLANEVGAGESVRVESWAPYEKCLEFMQASQACVVPHNAFEHTQTTVPHKLFQYMYCGTPVIVSDCRPLKRIVEDSGAGVVFRANDVCDFARTVVRLARDAALCRTCAENGVIAARTNYAWRNDARSLVAMYNDLAQRLNQPLWRAAVDG